MTTAPAPTRTATGETATGEAAVGRTAAGAADGAGATALTIAGAGLAGSLLAVFAARRGHQVTVFERRADPRAAGDAVGRRSINLGLSARGLHALQQVELLDELRPSLTPMRGRVVHHQDGNLSFQPYGVSGAQILHSVRRHDLNVALIDRAEQLGVAFHFETPIGAVDPARRTAALADGTEVLASVVVGADGVHSAVRQHLGGRTDVQTLEWGYKELLIPAGPPGDQRTDPTALHVWPGEHGLIVAHPNVDGSLTGTVFLPHDGEFSLATLTSPERIERYFSEHFPDAIALIPALVQEFAEHPVGSLHTVRTDRWHAGGAAVLIGDAAHGVYPFYGQGMNSSFEDCSVLDECLAAHGSDLAAAFAEFQRRRRRHTDVLADLSVRNFIELRDRVDSPWYALRRRADLTLNRLLGERWLPLYTMVSHTRVPYADALARARRQDRTVAALGAIFSTLIAAGLAAVGVALANRRRFRPGGSGRRTGERGAPERRATGRRATGRRTTDRRTTGRPAAERRTTGTRSVEPGTPQPRTRRGEPC